MMLRRVKPVQGWGSFVGEVVIVVLGVVIALGANELVQRRQWANEVREARKSLDAQLADSLSASLERIKLRACEKEQLDWLHAQLDKDEVPEFPPSFLPPTLRLWPVSAYDAATASGALAHMDADTRNRYAELVAFADTLRAMDMEKFKAWAELRRVRRHRQLDPVSRDRLRAALSTLDAYNFAIAHGAAQWVETAKPLRLTLGKEDLDWLAKPISCPIPDTPTKAAPTS